MQEGTISGNAACNSPNRSAGNKNGSGGGRRGEEVVRKRRCWGHCGFSEEWLDSWQRKPEVPPGAKQSMSLDGQVQVEIEKQSIDKTWVTLQSGIFNGVSFQSRFPTSLLSVHINSDELHLRTALRCYLHSLRLKRENPLTDIIRCPSR